MRARNLKKSGMLDKNDENGPVPAKTGKARANGH
jgi:hypothetical protein